MSHNRGRDYALLTYLAAMLLGACSSEPSKPASDADDEPTAGSSGAAAGGAGGAAVDAKARCRLPDGWPTRDSVLSMAEPLPDTGDIDQLIMTSLGLHWFGDVGKVLYRLGADGNPMPMAMTDNAGFTELEASDSAVVWLWGSSVWALLLEAGAAPAEIGTDISLTGNPLLVDETHVYFEPAFGTPGFTRIPLVGGAPEKVPTDIAARDVIAVHDGYAYYREPDSFTGDLLMRAPLDGGPVEQVDDSLGFLASPEIVFDGNVMYVSTTRLARIDLGSPNSATIVLLLAAARNQGVNNGLTRLVLDGDRLVYADVQGTVGWVTTDGTECANILVDPDQGSEVAGPPIDLALDDEYLYLLVFSKSASGSTTGSLRRIARSSVGL